MRRILIALLSVVTVVVAAGYVLLRTDAGQALLKSVLANAVSSSLQSEVRIARLSGDLPGQIRIEGVSASENGSEWLAIDKVEIDMNAWALLSQRIEVDRLAIGRIRLTGDRPPRRKAATPSRRSFTPPDRLPYIAIRTFSLGSLILDEGEDGELIDLSADGSLISGGEEIDLQLRADSSGAADRISILIAHHTGETRAKVDIDVESRTEGVISRLANLGGPLSAKITGDAPLADYRLNIQATLADLGSVKAEATGDLLARSDMRIAATARPGARLAELDTTLGDEVGANIRATKTERGGQIFVDNLSLAAGRMTGAANWQTRGAKLSSVQFDLNAAFAGDFHSELQALLGANVTASGLLKPTGDFYEVRLDLTSPQLQIALSEARTDLSGRLEGVLEAKLVKSPAWPEILGDETRLSARVSANRRKFIAVDNLLLAIDGRDVVRGSGKYDIPSTQINAEGDVTINPPIAARLQSVATPQGDLVARFAVTGAAEDFSIRLDGRTPALTFAKGEIPEATFSALASGLPHTPQVELNGTDRAQGRVLLRAGVEQSGRISVSEIRLVGNGFRLSGGGRFIRDGSSGAIDIDYLGEAGATPWPGLILEGDARLAAQFDAAQNESKISARSARLRIGDHLVAGVTVDASGPLTELPVRLNAEIIDLARGPVIQDLQSRTVADLRNNREIEIVELAFLADGEPISLIAPMTINLEDGFVMSGLRARYGEKGAVEANANIKPKRWQGDLRVSGFPLIAAASSLDAEVTLDTSSDEIGAGRVVLKSEISATPETVLDARLAWNGRSFTIISTETENRLLIDMTLPLRLTRENRLGVDASGALEGKLAYTGKLEKVAALLPSAIQSLEGPVNLSISVAGTFDEPQVDGSLRVEGGAYTEASSGLSIIGIDADARAASSADGFTVSYTLAASGPGQTAKTIRSVGDLSVGEGSMLRASLDLDRARFAAGPVASIITSGKLLIEGPLDAVRGEVLASGEFTINELDAEVETPQSTGLVNIDVVAIDENGDPTTDAPRASNAPPIRLQIKVNAPDRIRIGGRGLESFWGADMSIEGRADEPVILGALRMRRGSIDFAGRRFNLTRGEILFDRLTPNNPVLDMRAEYATSNGTVAAIVISGRAATPVVALQSTPALPQEDIMALILFGKPATELTAFESLQMAQALAQLSGIGPFGGGGTGVARRALGLDMLNLDFDPENGSSSSLTVGKYVTDGLFVSATQDARGENGSVRVQYEVSRNIVLETELKQSGDQTISANWKKDF